MVKILEVLLPALPNPKYFSDFKENMILIIFILKVAQLCLTLCDPIDYTVHGILQARILEWGAFPFFRGSFQPRD